MGNQVITEMKEELMNCLKRNDDRLDKTTKIRRQSMHGSNMCVQIDSKKNFCARARLISLFGLLVKDRS